MIIACPDCGHQVSDAAQACIRCGRPLAAPLTPAVQPLHAPVVTIEKTSKALKKDRVTYTVALLLGLFVLFVGMGVHSAGATVFGVLVLALGFVGNMVTAMRIWWRHG